MNQLSAHLILSLIALSNAFPAQLLATLTKDLDLENLTSTTTKRSANVDFDPKAQYISTSGAHAFVAPGPNDQRGPCPGLNALANHNYLPHDGVATIPQFVAATNSVFGMSSELASFLSIYGAVFDGNLVSWSIGGPPSTLFTPMWRLLGDAPQGISGSHNKYEADVSPTRGDLYLTGNNYEVQMERFKSLYALQEDETEETSNYDLTVLTQLRAERFQESKTTNPYFFNGPFSGLLVQPAAYTFIFRFMANKSAEYPEGRLSQNVLKSFYSISGDSPEEFEYTPGWERIPDNWYKRAKGDEYGLSEFLTDVLAAAKEHPEFLSVGGNTGTPDSFTGVDIEDLSGGVFNTKTLGEGNNLACFVFQLIGQMTPDILEGLAGRLLEKTFQLTEALEKIVSRLQCPKLAKVDKEQYAKQFSPFPGVTQLQEDGKYDGGAEASVYTKEGGLKGGIL